MSNLVHSDYADLARGLMSLLSDEDLAALVKTASAGSIMPVDRNESYTAVLLSCGDVAKLLSFRKLTSHLLLQYVLNRNIVRINGHISRVELVVTIKQYWDKQLKRRKRQAAKQQCNGEANPRVNPEPNVRVKIEPNVRVKIEPNVRVKIEPNVRVKIEPNVRVKTESTSRFETEPNIRIKTEQGKFPSDHLKKEPVLFDMPDQDEDLPSLYTNCDSKSFPLNNNVSQTQNLPHPSHSRLVSNNDQPSCSYDQVPSTSNNSVSCSTAPNSNMVSVMSDEFSHDFCEWFYTMLNRLQPECYNNPGDTLRPEVFCSNCKVEMYLHDGERMEECKAETSQLADSIIRNLLLQLKLLFVPNIDGGMQARKSTHGMIQLFCCGTLHSGSSFIGIFEQEFGLVISPIDRAWKIAYTKINLKKMADASIPSLPPSKVFAIDY